MDQPLSIIITDDHKLFRDGLHQVIRRMNNVRSIKQAGNGIEVMNLLAQDKYHLVFLDITMPEMNGIDTAKQMRKKYPETKIIALSMHHNLDTVYKMLDAGVAGYLLKDAPLSEIRKSVSEVIQGRNYYSPEIETAIQNRNKRPSESDSSKELNEREREILKLICAELSTKSIADKLFISARTVETYRESLLKKTNSKNIAGLVLYAVNNNLLLFFSRFIKSLCIALPS